MIIDSPSAFKLREKPERGNESTEKSGKSWSVPRPNREIREQSLFLSSHKQTLSWLKTRRRLKMRFLRANSRRGPWRVLSAQSRGPQRPRQFEPLIDSLRRRGGREWREKTRVKGMSEGGGGGTSNLTYFRQRQKFMMQRKLCVLLCSSVFLRSWFLKFLCSALRVMKERSR